VEFNSCIYIADTNNHAIRVVRGQNKESEYPILCEIYI
jgi:hypothetical protein